MIEDPDRVRARADALSPEEIEAGSDDPLAQAEAILEESDAREADRVDPPGQSVEHRRSEDTVELPVVRPERDDDGDERQAAPNP
jgi:hypothetical protein